MSECNAIIEANNEIDRLKRENKKLNALCVQYGFDIGRLEEKNEQLKQLVNEAEDIIICQCTPYYQRIWENIKKNIKGDME